MRSTKKKERKGRMNKKGEKHDILLDEVNNDADNVLDVDGQSQFKKIGGDENYVGNSYSNNRFVSKKVLEAEISSRQRKR